MSALVTPGNLRSALAVTRSLGWQGITVAIADEGLEVFRRDDPPPAVVELSQYVRQAPRGAVE